jgi:hypothetical protein
MRVYISIRLCCLDKNEQHVSKKKHSLRISEKEYNSSAVLSQTISSLTGLNNVNK